MRDKWYIILFALVLIGCTSNSPIRVDGTWCAMGTSITWYNDYPYKEVKHGYQDYVSENIAFSTVLNKGINGGTISQAIDSVVPADFYSVEFGINDWYYGTPIDEFKCSYIALLDSIYSVNAEATILLCTPRKAYGYNGKLPEHWYDEQKGHFLKEYVDVIQEIAFEYRLPVADFFELCGEQDELKDLSIDVALHPNDSGYVRMANVLVAQWSEILNLQ